MFPDDARQIVEHNRLIGATHFFGETHGALSHSPTVTRDDARGLTEMAICGLLLASKPRMNRELSEWVGDNPAYRRFVAEALGVVHVLITARNNRRWSHAL
jgi:hypothetical protein